MLVRGIGGLQPASEEAARSLACPPYDVVTRKDTQQLLASGACRFLNVVRADALLPLDTAASGIHEAASNALDELQSTGLLQETEPAICVYQLQHGEHTQRGVAALVSIDDYIKGVIRPHELTRKHKEDERAALAEALCAHSGPVLLGYRRAHAVDETIAAVMRGAPMWSVECQGVTHSVWRATHDQSNALVKAFQQHVATSYIADGHHRAASASRVAINRRMLGGTQTDRASDWFTAVLFAADEMHARPYYRRVWVDSVAKISGLKRMSMRPDADPPRGIVYVACRAEGDHSQVEWHSLDLKATSDSVDNQLLQDEVLAPCFDISDPRTDERVGFVGGLTIAELEKDVAIRGGIAFAPAAASMDEVMRVVDSGAMMPPKSTWFEPKLCSGLFVHTF